MNGQSFQNARPDTMTQANEQMDLEVEGEVAGYLLGTCGPAEGMIIPLVEGSYIVGRGVHASIYIQDDRVSREHTLVLVGAGGTVMMIDLHAGNGTRVNNARITKAVLRDGDRIETGNSGFLFTRDTPTEGSSQGA
jgi:pSer/pThr/pTyr-binding forkhead associated (FHA) protein